MGIFNRYKNRKNIESAVEGNYGSLFTSRGNSITVDENNITEIPSVKNALDYLNKGHKVRGFIRFKGRQMAHPELGREVLNNFALKLEEVSIVETPVKQDGRNMFIILAPKK